MIIMFKIYLYLQFSNLKNRKIENTSLNSTNESMKYSKTIRVKNEEKEKRYKPYVLVDLVEKNLNSLL